LSPRMFKARRKLYAGKLSPSSCSLFFTAAQHIVSAVVPLHRSKRVLRHAHPFLQFFLVRAYGQYTLLGFGFLRSRTWLLGFSSTSSGSEFLTDTLQYVLAVLFSVDSRYSKNFCLCDRVHRLVHWRQASRLPYTLVPWFSRYRTRLSVCHSFRNEPFFLAIYAFFQFPRLFLL